MFTLNEHSHEFYETINKGKALLAQILADPSLRGEVREFSAGDLLIDLKEELTEVFFVKEGFLRLEHSGKPVLFYEPGELVGWASPVTEGNMVICESAVTLLSFQKAGFLSSIARNRELSSRWTSWIEVQFKIFTYLLSEEEPQDIPEINPVRRHFDAGAPIIIQGTSNLDVYTLLHGEADVYLNDTIVGGVKTGEIFGAMAASSNTTRSASVIARTPCVVSIIPKGNFLGLIKSRPNTVLKLIEDMARIIMSQNEKIVEMKSRLEAH